MTDCYLCNSLKELLKKTHNSEQIQALIREHELFSGHKISSEATKGD